MAEIKAVINGERIECGKCGHLIGMVQCPVVVSHQAESNNTDYIEARAKLTIKCKHKDKGKTCNAINEILL
jgi:hypothetical protein